MHTSSASFGDTLKEYRQRKKLTQRQLATALGVHYNTIWAWERGDYLPETRGIVLELARLLRLTEQETRHLLEASLLALSPYWMVPAQRNPFFTGREEVLQQIHTALQPQHTTQARSYGLTGMGGVGKTQVALEYAYRFFQDYSAIFWITAETHESIFTSLSKLAELLQLPLGQDQQKMIDAITRWLANHRDWLLIVDNVEDPALIQELLPKARQGAFLFTTRRQSLGALAPCTVLEPMNQEEGIQFLLRRSGQPEHVSSADTSGSGADTSGSGIETAAGKLVNTLGGLPLALDQAGAYIEKTHCSLPDFLHLFQEHALTLLEERDHHADHPLSVASTFALAFEKVQQEHPAAADLLRLCSLLAPDDIPEELFTQNASLLGDELAIVVTQPLKWNAVLQTLLSYALIQRNPQTRSLTIHRIVQTVIREQMSQQEQRQWAERVVRLINQAFPDTDMDDIAIWPQQQRYLPHTEACLSLVTHYQLFLPEAGSLLHCAGIYLHRHNQYQQAETFYLQTQSIYERALGPKHAKLSKLLKDLASLYSDKGKYVESETLNQRALVIGEEALGTEHPELAKILSNQSLVYDKLERYQEAEACLQRAINICEGALGPNDLETARAINNLSTLYYRQSRYAEAEVLLQRATHICEQTLGPKHPHTATLLHNQARLYSTQQKYEQAEDLFQQALAIFEQTLGPDHLHTTFVLHSQGLLYYVQRKYEQAEQYYQRALITLERIVDVDPVHIAGVLHDLAQLYTTQYRYNEAEPLCKRALELREEALGNEHIATKETQKLSQEIHAAVEEEKTST